MFGWRKRIGYIAPTVIEVLAYEFYQFAPEGVGLVGVTCGIDDWRPEEFDKGLAQVRAKGGVRIASGETLADLGLSQDMLTAPRGFALQCRITTEDPANGFRPDSGRITANSSPPTRQGISVARTAAFTRSATSASTASPARWPCRSLTDLKLSRSNTISES